MIRWLYYALRRWYYRNVYLKSRHWKLFRLYALGAAHHECQVDGCQVVSPEHKIVEGLAFKYVQWLQVHHRRYETLGRESLKDVTVLCSFHHAQVELGYEMPLKDGTTLPGYKKYKVVNL